MLDAFRKNCEMNHLISVIAHIDPSLAEDEASCMCMRAPIEKAKLPALERYIPATWAMVFGFVLFLCPLIGFNVSASPLPQVTPTVVFFTPTAQIPGSIIDSQIYSGTSSTTGERIYEVKSGDTLWSIATNVYGNGAMYQLIQQANGLPDKAVLKVGSKLLIPSIESATPSPSPSPQVMESTKRTATPVLQDIVNTPTRQPSNSTPLPVTASPTATFIPIMPEIVPVKPTRADGQEWSSIVRYLQLSMLLLSIACFLSSLYCAYLSFEIYQRHRPYIRRRDIRNRVRAGL